MNIVIKRERLALLIALCVVVSAAAGCMPRAGMSNPGWTVLTVQDGIVYGALSTGYVVALSSSEGGAEVWSYPVATKSSGGTSCFNPLAANTEGDTALDAVYGLPVLTQDLVLVASYDHHLYGFDRETGERSLIFPELGANDVEGAVIGGTVVSDGLAYFGSSDHRIYALDLESGELVWDKPFETQDWVWSTPEVDGERVYVGSMDHNVYALDRKSGNEVWRCDVGASVPGAVTLADGVLYVGAIDRRLHAVDSATGREVWQTEEFGGWLWGEALVVADSVYFGALDGTVHAVSITDGTTRWSVELEGAVRAGPALIGDELIIGTEAGKLYVIGLTDGDAEAVFDAEGAILSAPAVEGDIAYLGTASGNVYALDLHRRGDPQLWVYPPPKK